MFPQIYYCSGIFVNPEGNMTLTPNMANHFYFMTNTQALFNIPNNQFESQQNLQKPVQRFIKQRPIRNKSRPSQSLTNLSTKAQEKPIKRIQNPLRNIFTNLTNLILNFFLCPKKIGDLLYSIDPSYTNQKLQLFEKYIKNLKSHFCGYFNMQRVHKLFFGTSFTNYSEQFHRMFRIVSKIFLQQKVPLCLATSKKLTPELRSQHFKARRLMLISLKRVSTNTNLL